MEKQDEKEIELLKKMNLIQKKVKKKMKKQPKKKKRKKKKKKNPRIQTKMIKVGLKVKKMKILKIQKVQILIQVRLWKEEKKGCLMQMIKI